MSSEVQVGRDGSACSNESEMVSNTRDLNLMPKNWDMFLSRS